MRALRHRDEIVQLKTLVAQLREPFAAAGAAAPALPFPGAPSLPTLEPSAGAEAAAAFGPGASASAAAAVPSAQPSPRTKLATASAAYVPTPDDADFTAEAPAPPPSTSGGGGSGPGLTSPTGVSTPAGAKLARHFSPQLSPSLADGSRPRWHSRKTAR